MKGFVPTPPHLVDAMVGKLFRDRRPQPEESLLDPGCGTGAFLQGVVRWCDTRSLPLPRMVGIESNPDHLREARGQLGHLDRITLLNEDFLKPRQDAFDYIIGNPPYVPITGLSVEERTMYRRRYATATGRFDLYLLFFDQALKLLKPNGRMVFVTPEKFLYVQTAEPLRRQLASIGVEEIELIEESVFGELITYPTITTVSGVLRTGETEIRLRDGTVRRVRLGPAGSSWLPLLNGAARASSGPVLADAFLRISCGVATGADNVFVVRDSELPQPLRRYAHPTLSGREIVPGKEIRPTRWMLVPYTREGALLAEGELGALGDYLRHPVRYARLLQRTCVARKPWYAFHENPPLDEILRPKILCKDIGARPWFVVEERGDIVPRHSVYYLMPREPAKIHDLCAYLNSDVVLEWFTAHCQRAANGFVRLQSHVLKQAPLPDRFLRARQLACV